MSESSQLRANSQRNIQSSESSQGSKKSNSKSDSSKKISESKKTSKSVLIQPRAITETEPYKYPDFSKTLSSQQGVITVNYDTDGNAHTSVADASGTLAPNDSYNEIPYPNNAFPSYIPGVSTETDYGKVKDNQKLRLPGEGLDGDKDYIYYTKVMAFRDDTGKQHWIDIKQKFTSLEKHGWYNDWPQWKAQGKYDGDNDKDSLYVNNWAFGYGRGVDKGIKDRQDMLGIRSVYPVDAFRTAQLMSKPFEQGGTPYAQKPKAKSQKPKAKSQKPKAKSQKPKAKSQKPKAKSQKPKAKSQKPIYNIDRQ